MSIRSIGGYRIQDASGYLAEHQDEAEGVIVVATNADGTISWRCFGDVKTGRLALLGACLIAQAAKEAGEP